MDNTEVRKSFSGLKIVFAILGIVILAEVIYAVRVLTLPVPVSPLPSQTSTRETLAAISLNVPQSIVSIGSTVPVSVMIDTGNHRVSGVDLIVRFDPKILDATAEGLVKGKIFDEYPLASVNAKEGTISISGISSTKNSFKGTGQFAVINLKTKKTGRTSLTIEFKKGSTTDSNLVETDTSRNILDTVGNLELMIQ